MSSSRSSPAAVPSNFHIAITSPDHSISDELLVLTQEQYVFNGENFNGLTAVTVTNGQTPTVFTLDPGTGVLRSGLAYCAEEDGEQEETGFAVIFFWDAADIANDGLIYITCTINPVGFILTCNSGAETSFWILPRNLRR